MTFVKYIFTYVRIKIFNFNDRKETQDMTLRHLTIFMAVYEQKSVTKAAEKLFISQPSASLAIREIERAYGITLFTRLSRRLIPTDTAKWLYECASSIIHQYHEMEEKLNHSEELPIRVGCTISIGNVVAPPLLHRWRSLFPENPINLTIANAGTIEQKIQDSALDIAMIEGVVHTDCIETEIFMNDSLAFVCSKDSPLAQKPSVSLSEFPDLDFILREPGSGTRELIDSCLLIRGYKIQPAWESVSTHAIIELVSRGLGVSILPARLVAQTIASGGIVTIPVEEVEFNRPFYIIHRRNKFLNRSMLRFMEEIRNMGKQMS